MKILLFFVSILSITTSFANEVCYPQKHANVPNIISLDYHSARKQLLINHWQPFQTLHFNKAKDELMYSGNGWGFWEKGYHEIEQCSGMGSAPCIFNFKDVCGNLLQIGTQGEEYPSAKIYASVKSVNFKCELNK